MTSNPNSLTKLIWLFSALPKKSYKMVGGKAKVVYKQKLPKPFRVGAGKLARGKVVMGRHNT